MSRSIGEALTASRSLADLHLPRFEGRLDLRGIVLTGLPFGESKSEAQGLVALPVKSLLEFRGVELRSIDLAGATLRGLRIFDGLIENVSFEDADCRDFRAWGLSVEDTLFRGTNLQGAVLGAVDGKRHSFYRSVDFTEANLRGIVSSNATFVDCDFSNARLDGIDFQSSKFVRCRFAGHLKNVIFWDRGFRPGGSEPNQMEDVDFSEASFSSVEFRRLDLDRVTFPSSPEHLVVGTYRRTLDCAIHEVEELDNPAARRAHALLKHLRKWSGPNQEFGVINPRDLGGNQSDADWLAEVLRRCEALGGSLGGGLANPGFVP